MALYVAAVFCPVALVLLMLGVGIVRFAVTGFTPGPVDILWLWRVWPFLWFGGLTISAAGLVVEIVRVLREPRRIDTVR